MKRHPKLFVVWIAVNSLLLAALAAMLYGFYWEYSTRRYLDGFADAVIPLSGSDLQKTEAILAWLEGGPPRRSTVETRVSPRDPTDTLNHQELLRVCGTATNAFVNLATSGGLEVRRLLLLDEKRLAKHVVAEVRIDGRWVVADPSYRILMRNARGDLLTKEELRDPSIWQEAVARIPGYPPNYTFERTTQVRLASIAVIGHYLRKALDLAVPGWEELNWSVVLERRSLALTWIASAFFFFLLFARWMIGRYAEKRLGIPRLHLRERLFSVYRALLEGPN